MKKIILLFSFFCIFKSLFGQIKKGTIFLGTSSFSATSTFREETFPLSSISPINKSLSQEFILSPEFGIFVAPNTMVGGGIDFIINSRRSTSVGNNIGLKIPHIDAFWRRYFLTGNVKPFVGATIAVDQGDLYGFLDIGAAHFLNDFTAIELSLHTILFENFDQILPYSLIPEIGLSLKWFLLRDQKSESPIQSRDYLQKGMLSAYFSGKLIGHDSGFNDSGDGDLNLITRVNYFFLDNIYANLNMDLATNVTRKYLNIDSRLEVGGYIPVGQSFAIKLAGTFIFDPYKTRSRNLLSADIDTKVGLVLFKNKHRIEVLSGLKFADIDKKGDDNSIPVTNVIFQINHEYFISKNLSIASQIDMLPNYQSSINTVLQGIIERKDDTYGIKCGIKWYINSYYL